MKCHQVLLIHDDVEPASLQLPFHLTRKRLLLGDLVWLHAPEIGCSRGLRQLALRLIDELGVTVLLTCPEEVPPTPGVVHQPPPDDTAADTRGFLAHWQPQLLLMAEGEVRMDDGRDPGTVMFLQGRVLDDQGQAIAGLYAAGRTALGIPSHLYISGLSLADCVFSGRRAGASVAESELHEHAQKTLGERPA